MIADQARTPAVLSTHLPSRAPLKNYGLLALFVLLLALAGIYWRPLGQMSTLWPANAILLGLFLRMPGLASPPGWLAAAGGFIMADVITGSHWDVAVSLSLANLLSVFIAFALCARLSESQRVQISPDALPRLFAAMLTASTLAGLTGGFAIWRLLGHSFWDATTHWVVSELLSYIILLPCILSAPAWQAWKQRERHSRSSTPLARKLVYGGSLFAALLASIFIGGPGAVAFPVCALLVCALSCGLFMTSVLTLAFSLWTLLGAAFGGINLAFDIADGNALLSLRLGIASTALAPIVVASVMAARERNLVTMRQLAEYDALTGLLNRRTFHQQACDRLARLIDAQKPAAILMVDLDHFKQINDTYGHAVGDEVLSRVAQKLRQSLRSDDLCGRLGGEEFAALIPNCTAELLETITQRVHEAIKNEHFALDEGRNVQLGLSVSIGATLNRGASDDLRAMLVRADHAMYAAKHAGRDQTRIV